jgi:hypothetical protein
MSKPTSHDPIFHSAADDQQPHVDIETCVE